LSVFNRPPLEERIRADQARRAPLEPGKVFEHAPAARMFFALIIIVILTHIAALAMIYWDPQ